MANFAETMAAVHAETQLKSLARAANQEHELVLATIARGLEHARRAGEILEQAKAVVPHGEWLPWLEANFVGSARTARLYQRIARQWPRIDVQIGSGIADLSLAAAERLLATPRAVAVSPSVVVDPPSVGVDAPSARVVPLILVTAVSVRSATVTKNVTAVGYSSTPVPEARRPSERRLGIISHLLTILEFYHATLPDDFATVLAPYSEISPSDLKQLSGWFGEAALALSAQRKLRDRPQENGDIKRVH